MSRRRIPIHGSTARDVKHERLYDYRVVYFATHALVAGEIEKFARAKAEPALVLSIPATPSEEDNGLLTASEVATLKLNDDFAMLSACNTAAGYKPGAEALSGLARAFFYAGARSLVVSHCNVDSEATVALMGGLFAALKAKSGSFPRGGLADVDVANDRQFFENRIDSAELLGSVRDCWRAEK